MTVSTAAGVSTTFNPAKILELRTSKGLSQRAFADRIGYSRAQINQVESGAATPSLKYLRKVAQVFEVDIRYFFAR